MGKLDGKVAVVTGSSRGIGKAIAEVFAAEGAKVVCAARTLKEGDHPLEGSLEHTVAGIRAAGGDAHAVAVNISEHDDCVRLIEEARKAYGPIDVLVNNAALTYFYPIKDFPVNRWLRSFSVNVDAMFILSQLALQDMIPRKSGAIVNISSGGAIGPGRGPYRTEFTEATDRGAPGGTLYGAEKAAMERFTQGLAEEVYADGVSVTCFSPSQVVPTPGTLFHNLVSGMDDPRGEPPEYMAKAALLLATEPLDRVTGRVTYSQEILLEFGWISEGHGTGVETKGSGYSLI
ncbi:MAG TPA: SDR family NAD(P)-dependent oxidoreductase [Tepidiformaceae bacterium]|nr:SDR family NAD(P)-dependent oxidoreductase [Tepidiformaceae bacterium]